MLKTLKKNIESLSIKNQFDIFNIIKESQPDTLNENNNGTFVNMSLLSDETLEKIKKQLEFCENQKNIIETGENEKDFLKKKHFKKN